ncbi:hypothetical protein XM38_034940 [Halomicronema hongdechloris C2206]|uniref:Uncharacterized protein n=1 Tax=Halomicronema hongdechloris C2206 TaxID=1641165 RepID=A0A1Z3HQL0_9CYAN|nr:hypothetical protein [Halomicronema hongdechloris]ASC72536.1 hypothetical protein XM38_034940 [Halomicronema hongdechloris C2206]
MAQHTWHSSRHRSPWNQVLRQLVQAFGWFGLDRIAGAVAPGILLWLVALTGGVLWLLHWQLVVAIATGLGGVYGMKYWPQLTPEPIPRLQQWLAASCQTAWAQGLGLMVGTYGLLALGTSSGSVWLPIIIAAQIGGILLLRDWPWPKANRRLSYPGDGLTAAEDIEPLLERLSNEDPMIRLVTVRQVLRQLSHLPQDRIYVPGTAITIHSHVIDCLHLMLAQETEPLVRTAIRDGVRHLYPLPRLQQGKPPVQLHRQSLSVHRHAVEYVEP